MENRRNFLKNQQGFTLVEIIAVLVILGILAAVAVPKFLDMQEDAQEKAVQGALAAATSNLTMSYSQYLLKNGSKPTTFTASTGDANAKWSGETGTDDVEVETDLGDFTASYEVDTENETIKIKITSKTFTIDSNITVEKTVNLEYGS